MKKYITSALASMLYLLVVHAVAGDVNNPHEEGKKIAFDRKKGNCLACHIIEDGELPGVLGPPLVAVKARYPDKAILREQIWDPSKRNPATSMPPFGKHRILTEDEIDKVVEYIHSL